MSIGSNIIDLQYIWTEKPVAGCLCTKYDGGWIHLRYRTGMMPNTWRDVEINGVPVKTEEV